MLGHQGALFVAGGRHLLRSAAPGAWEPVAGAPEWIRALASGPGNTLLALGGSGSFAFDGSTWRTLSQGGGEAVAADGANIYLVESVSKQIG